MRRKNYRRRKKWKKRSMRRQRSSRTRGKIQFFFCERSFSFWTCRTGVCVGLKKRDKKRAKQDPRNRSVTRGKSEEDLAVVIAVTRALSRKSKRTQKHTNTDARIKSLSTSGQTLA